MEEFVAYVETLLSQLAEPLSILEIQIEFHYVLEGQTTILDEMRIVRQSALEVKTELIDLLVKTIKTADERKDPKVRAEATARIRTELLVLSAKIEQVNRLMSATFKVAKEYYDVKRQVLNLDEIKKSKLNQHW